jgi:hypothetical protein
MQEKAERCPCHGPRRHARSAPAAVPRRAVRRDHPARRGDDPDGLPALIQRTNEKAGGSPADGVEEKRWLRRFLRVRRADLGHAHDPDTREEWASAVDRVDAFLDILKDGNVNLDGSIHVKTPQHEATIP